MPLNDTRQRRSGLHTRLQALDLSPWHDVYGINVWRSGLHEYKLALGQQIMRSACSIDDAVEYIIANGWER